MPETGSEEIELYLRTIYSLLRSSDEVQIKALVEAHANMASSLHPGARDENPDVSALAYSSLRLPACIRQVRLVVLGQSEAGFRRGGYPDVEQWESVSAPARRRRCYYDGGETLAAYIASRSDIDDIVPMLTAYQIEWNKLHYRLQSPPVRRFLDEARRGDFTLDDEALGALAAGLLMPSEDLDRLHGVWGKDFLPRLEAVAAAPKKFAVRLLGGSLADYRRATDSWWEHIQAAAGCRIAGRPVYFVSSNMHSLVNVLSGYALRHADELVGYVESREHADLLAEWHEIEARQVPSSRENFLYYVMKKYARAPEGRTAAADRARQEQICGIRRTPSEHSFEVDAEIIELSRLRPDWIDPRLVMPGVETLAHSQALIWNIDYPLGWAAYLLLSRVADVVGELRGVYVLGKAATLNGVIGDVTLPNVVYDEHSRNTYLFVNSFKAADVAQHLVYGSVLDNQKGVSVRGTFLQNARYMDVFYREGYTDIEMEAGPYLSAVYEAYRPTRYPTNEIVNLQSVPFDVGILHYASDTPFSKGRNLGAGTLSYFGMDPTYAASIAILRRILKHEIERTRSDGAGGA